MCDMNPIDTSMNIPLIGVDLGGSKTEVIVMDPQGHILHRSRQPTPAHRYEDLLTCLLGLVNQARSALNLPSTLPVGVGIPGCLDRHTQTVRGANTQCLNGKPLLADLKTHSACDWRLENDANCLVLSEACDGAAAGAGLVFGAILGTGCGGGWAWRGELWSGPNALSGEWGHNPLPWANESERDIPPCWCGLQGCLETWISGSGATAQFKRETGLDLDMKQWVQKLRQGDPVCEASWSRFISRLARAFAQVINQNDPDVIVIGGGLSLIDEVLEQVPARWSQWGFHRPLTTPLRRALHGDSSGVRGAAWLWRSETQSPPVGMGGA